VATDQGSFSRRARRAVPAAAIAVLVAAGCVASVRVGAPGSGVTSASPGIGPLVTPDSGLWRGDTAPYATPGTGGGATAASGPAAAIAAVDELRAGRVDVTLAAAVADGATGKFVGTVSATEPMYSASLVKIVLAVDLLQRRRSGLAVGPEDLALLRRALGPSDDQAMNLLWTAFDGPAAVVRVAHQLELTATRPPADPSQWGESLVSARDMVVLITHVLRMPAWERELIMGALATAPPIAADGFDQAFGLQAAAPDPSVAVKQGWMCCPDDRITLHSAGTIGEQRRFVVALLSSHPAGQGYDAARETVTVAADAVRAALR
jgi:hypothetical protein